MDVKFLLQKRKPSLDVRIRWTLTLEICIAYWFERKEFFLCCGDKFAKKLNDCELATEY